MVRRNNQTNRLIMWVIIIGDFVLLNVILYAFSRMTGLMDHWSYMQTRIFFQFSNVALMMSEWKFHTTIQERVVSAGDVLRLLSLLTTTQALLSYALMRHWLYQFSIGRLIMMIGAVFFMSLVILRLIGRSIIKGVRRLGRNTRKVTFVGNDKELKRVYDQLISNPTSGYRVSLAGRPQLLAAPFTHTLPHCVQCERRQLPCGRQRVSSAASHVPRHTVTVPPCRPGVSATSLT